MGKAITYNNAGIVEAIKRNSGSTKFYKPSYQGIIEAIQDWSGEGSGDGGSGSGGGDSSTGGGGTNVLPEGGNLPDTGNTEGDLVVIPNGVGDYFMYVYANGAWERLHITTEEVETAGSAPFALVTDDGVTVKNQKEINAYLADRITTLSEKGYDDTGIKADLAQESTDRIEGDQALQNQIDALEAYDDTDIKADLAQEIKDREAGDADLQGQIDALPETVSYILQTDKVLRAGEPAIELVDSDGFFSNVKFETAGLISVESSASSIIVNSNQIEERVDQGLSEQDAELQVHSDQINLLETQFLLLAQTRAAGRWKYVRNVANGPRPPATKTFYATDGADSSVVITDWKDARLLMVSKTDLNDTSFTFTNFAEGDKLEIIAADGSSACFGTVINQPTQESYGNLIIAVERSTSGPIENKEYILSVYRPGAVGGEVDLDTLDNRYVIKTGDEMTGNLKVPDPLPNEPLHAANKKYVDEAVSGGVPVGSIMLWINNNPPAGWFKLTGGTFDTSAYPQLHAYLLNTSGYVAGTLPNWAGHYPGEAGDHLNGNLGSFADYLTARPKTIDFGTDNPGNHTHKYGNSNLYSSGTSQKAHDASNNQSYDTSGAGSHTHKITSGGDSTTRPKTVVVHYIIKHD